MNQTEFIIRQLAKTNKKNYENYVVTRLYHRINRDDLKFVTQQYVHRPEGHALTDIYFPQLNVHIEIDEAFHGKQQIQDINRETDIIEATGHDIFRVKITDELSGINQQIEDLLILITDRIETKIKNGSWQPWDIEKEFDPEFHRKKGYLAVEEQPAFRRIVDACNCLGQQYEAVQQAWFKSKVYEGYYLWFPKFYENEDWDNSISGDGKIITQRCKKPEIYEAWFNQIIQQKVKRITFPRRIDQLGFRLYRFAGIFETDMEASSFKNGIIYKRVADRFVF